MRKAYEQILVDGLSAIEKDVQEVCELPQEIYTDTSSGRSSIGAHMRHVLEFSKILSENDGSGPVDYESRSRNIMLETNPVLAGETFSEITRSLENALDTNGANHIVNIIEMPGFGLPQVEVPSSLGREILFMIEHAIHHFAIIKMSAEQQGYELSKGFGVAPSTQTYESKTVSTKAA